MKTLFILNDPPYGTERSYNGLRLARALSKQPDQKVRVFLMGDAVACAKAGQKLPEGYYNAGDMVKMVAAVGEVGLCATCMTARGLEEDDLVAGAVRKTLNDLAAWTAEADKVLVF
ncbi:MAG: DsrE family protein [Rhodocyclaceae bacterium]|nr:DsrE family protein [Rhodocyclaceae bacterium]